MTPEDWRDVAAAWDRHHDWNAKCFRPLIDWCRTAIRLASNAHVIDIAGGSGIPAMEIARALGPQGKVLATDLSPEMLESSERRAHADGLRNIAFRVMNAEALDVPDQSFDAATFTFGLMLCPHPVNAVREVRRVLKPGGRFAIAVWDKPSRNPFLAVFGRAALEVLGLPTPERTDPGPFRFADPAELERVLRDGGLTDFTIERVETSMDYESVENYLDVSKGLSPGLGLKIRSLPPHDAARFDALVREGAAPFARGTRVAFPASVLCASGAVP